VRRGLRGPPARPSSRDLRAGAHPRRQGRPLRRYGARVSTNRRQLRRSVGGQPGGARETGALEVHAYDQPESLRDRARSRASSSCSAPGSIAVAWTRCSCRGRSGLSRRRGMVCRPRESGCRRAPSAAPTLYTAIRNGAPVDVEVGGIAADSLGARRIGQIAFDVASATWTASCWSAIRRSATLSARCGTACGCDRAGRRPLRLPAYARAKVRTVAPGERVGVIVCGGNTRSGEVAA